jgi:hypothetical protein
VLDIGQGRSIGSWSKLGRDALNRVPAAIDRHRLGLWRGCICARNVLVCKEEIV